jgi:hypothetical protein
MKIWTAIRPSSSVVVRSVCDVVSAYRFRGGGGVSVAMRRRWYLSAEWLIARNTTSANCENVAPRSSRARLRLDSVGGRRCSRRRSPPVPVVYIINHAALCRSPCTSEYIYIYRIASHRTVYCIVYGIQRDTTAPVVRGLETQRETVCDIKTNILIFYNICIS